MGGREVEPVHAGEGVGEWVGCCGVEDDLGWACCARGEECEGW